MAKKTVAAKQFQVNQIIIDILMLVLGVVLIVWPVDSAKMLTLILGVVLIVCGLIELIVFIRDVEKTFLDYLRLIGGIIIAAIGLFLAFNPDWLVQFFNFMFGAMIIIYGLFNIFNAIAAKSLEGIWFVPLIMGIVAIGLGALVLINPFSTAKFLMITIGISLIFAAVTSVINDIRLYKAKKLFDKLLKEEETSNMKSAGSDETCECKK